MNIALKEANETEYWLELLIQSDFLSGYDTKGVLQHCNEICRILDSIVITGMKNADSGISDGTVDSFV